MTTSRRNTIMLWMAYTEFFYPGCELQPGYFYLSIPELYYIPEDGACIGAVGVDAYGKVRQIAKAPSQPVLAELPLTKPVQDCSLKRDLFVPDPRYSPGTSMVRSDRAKVQQGWI